MLMKSRQWLRLVVAGLAWVALAAPSSAARGETPLPRVVEFNRDVRPILSNHCFACHGPDKNKRKADLRLDTEEGARADLGGYHAVMPRKPAQSELYLKISAADPAERMPPKKFGKPLTPRQVALLKRWIEQGAKWQKHWSLIAPRRPAVPEVRDKDWALNAIDRFILAPLEQEGLKPSPEADRRILLRRLSFDLTGLPPTPADVDAFLGDASPAAYEKAVDRLLASPHFGERLAVYWLDLVRYGDTGGYHSDNHRDVYLYRDYVIAAFNANKPFDRFTVEQLAGDLLPQATREQMIASGYNRLLLTTEEGGAQPKEYTAKYSADRVRNASAVWLGATMGCAECHDHKFDPYKTREFYAFAAFFADIKEKPVGRQDQTPMPTGEQAAQLRELDAAMAAVQKELATQTPALDQAQGAWEQSARAGKVKGLPPAIAAALAVDPDKRTPQQKQALATHYRAIAPALEASRRRLADLGRRKAALVKSIPTTLISIAGPPRVVRVLLRGNWLDDSGEMVTPGVPAALPPLPVKGRRATRLDLARWLVAPEHPMVARVFVNRLWKLAFGQGLVKTLEDFGSQGAWPTHPELLDWLAVEFRESGWDIKHVVKLLVMSRAYRQTSHASALLRQRDPYNHLVARQDRFRLGAEMVRDNALAVSGLLVPRIGGPSVKPYQPAGYWAFLNFPRRTYQKDTGPNEYRRGLYTYVQRTFPHPSLLAFDAPSREECTVQRPRSNTPQQALVLLNDPTYVEAARALAERIVRQGAGTGPRIRFAFREVLSRPARPAEVGLLEALYRKHLAQYRADPKAAAALLAVGDRPAPKDMDAAELAAWTSVARVVLNLHETITRN
jgi:hypothetical protein